MAGHTTDFSDVPHLASREGAWVLIGPHTPAQLAAARAVGYHHYSRVGAHEAVERVQAQCPPGWHALWRFWGHAADPQQYAAVVRVGQTRVHAGDPEIALYIYTTGGREAPPPEGEHDDGL